jgi:hypothetical protein
MPNPERVRDAVAFVRYWFGGDGETTYTPTESTAERWINRDYSTVREADRSSSAHLSIVNSTALAGRSVVAHIRAAR